MTPTPKFGSYLVIPLKHDKQDFRTVASSLPSCPMTTMDLNENVKEMLSGSADEAVGRCCRIEADTVRRAVTGGKEGQLEICEGEAAYPFDFYTSYLYIFSTQVAFFCLGVTYERMEALSALYSPGYANTTATVLLDGHALALEDKLAALCRTWGLEKFFDGPSPLLLDAFVHTTGLWPDYFATTDELQHATFRLHQMLPPDGGVEDASEEDTRYVYAVKIAQRDAYRWGCCISSQTISYAVADEAMDLHAELDTQAADALPMVALMMYQKYTCLRFASLIARRKERNARHLRHLKEMLLHFRAFGTVAPANLSRWYNVRRIYHHLLDTNDITTTVEDVSTKLNILTNEQEELDAQRSSRVVNIITIFGIVSILASVLSIIQILAGGGFVFWLSTILTTVLLLVMLLLAMRHK